jgi:hypothetical protein
MKNKFHTFAEKHPCVHRTKIIIMSAIRFVINGFRAFSEASKGQYRSKNSDIEKWREELFEQKNTNQSEDKKRLRADRSMIAKDAAKAWKNVSAKC